MSNSRSKTSRYGLYEEGGRLMDGLLDGYAGLARQIDIGAALLYLETQGSVLLLGSHIKARRIWGSHEGREERYMLIGEYPWAAPTISALVSALSGFFELVKELPVEVHGRHHRIIGIGERREQIEEIEEGIAALRTNGPRLVPALTALVPYLETRIAIGEQTNVHSGSFQESMAFLAWLLTSATAVRGFDLKLVTADLEFDGVDVAVYPHHRDARQRGPDVVLEKMSVTVAPRSQQLLDLFSPVMPALHLHPVGTPLTREQVSQDLLRAAVQRQPVRVLEYLAADRGRAKSRSCGRKLARSFVVTYAHERAFEDRAQQIYRGLDVKTRKEIRPVLLSDDVAWVDLYADLFRGALYGGGARQLDAVLKRPSVRAEADIALTTAIRGGLEKIPWDADAFQKGTVLLARLIAYPPTDLSASGRTIVRELASFLEIHGALGRGFMRKHRENLHRFGACSSNGTMTVRGILRQKRGSGMWPNLRS